jgi:N-acyl-D-amino-acid deacylase
MNEIVIKNGIVIDGTGVEPYLSDIGISNGKISRIGECHENYDIEIDAKGMTVSPGFIDAHTHSEVPLLVDGSVVTALRQGCTCLCVGNCGNSNFPIVEKNVEYYEDLISKEFQFPMDPKDIHFEDFSAYKKALNDNGVSVNVIPLIGYDAIRSAVMGVTDAEPDNEQLEQMKQYLEQALTQGVFGMSTGLEYAPQIFSTTDELIELSRILARHNRLYVSHIRNMYDDLVGGIEEALRIGRETGAQVHLSHMQVNGFKFKGAVAKAVEVIKQAIDDGIRITYDFHPWTGGMSPSVKPLPAWVKADGNQGVVKNLSDPETAAKIKKEMEEKPYYASYDEMFFPLLKNPETSGKFLTEIADILHRDPIDALFSLIIDEGGSSLMVEFTMYEEDIKSALRYPESVVGSDNFAIPRGMQSNHPRHVCCFPYMIEKYVRKEKLVSLPEMVSKMTGKTAKIFGIPDRGLIKEGYWADIVIFDPNKMRSNMDYKKPDAKPTGISKVIVNGVIAYEDGEATETRSGKVIEP